MEKKSGPKIRILIADDHSILRDSLKDALGRQKNLEIVGDAGDGEECLRLAKSLKPDVILLDIKLPKASGIEITRQIKKTLPEIKILILSTYDDDLHVFEAFHAGADGFLSKVTPVQEMIDTICKIDKEGMMIPEKIAPKLLRGIRNLDVKKVSEFVNSNLTPAELRVINCVKKGKDNKEIARELSIGQKTVRNHLSSIFLKLDARTRTDAVVKAIAKGIISLE